MSSDDVQITFTDRALDALASVRTLVVPTDLDGAGCVAVARRAASHVADGRMTVVLYDRSEETWMDHPHPSGPHTISALGEQHDELRAQMRELEAAGVEVRAWISTVPALTEIVGALQETGADAVLLPDQSCDRTLMDRLTGEGDSNTQVAKAVDTQLERSVAVLSIDDGTVDLLAVTDPRANRSDPN